MGQRDVYNFLKKNRRKWFSTKELSDRLEISRKCVVSACSRLRKAKMVYHKQTKSVSVSRMVPVYSLKK